MALPFVLNTPRALATLRQATEYSDDLSGRLKKRRADLNVTQSMAAQRIGVSKFTYRLWECDAHRPVITQWPAIIAFLGSDPNGEPDTLGGYLQAWRRAEGLSRKSLADALGLDPGTLAKLEQDRYVRIDPRVRQTVDALERRFGASSSRMTG